MDQISSVDIHPDYQWELDEYRKQRVIPNAEKQELLAAIEAEGAQSFESRAFDSVTGLSEFAVGVLNRIGVMKLYPSQRRVLEYLRVKGQDGNDDDYNRVIISPHSAGKSTLLAFGDNKAYICTLFGEEDEKLVETYKTSFKSVNGSSLVIDGENIESNNIPVVTGADILHAPDSDDYN